MALKPDAFAGREMGGPDDTLDNLYDPETNPNKDLPLDELERLIDSDGEPAATKDVKVETEDTGSQDESEESESKEQEPKESVDESETETKTEVEVPGEPTETKVPTLEERLSAFEQREEKRELELERLRLHNSRLAAKLGNAEKKLSERLNRRESGEIDDDGLTDLREEIANLKADRHAEALANAVREEFQRFQTRPGVAELGPMLQKLAPKFEHRYEELASIQDVTEARLAARELQIDLLEEARTEKTKADRAEAERRKLDASAKLKTDKKKASVTESSVRGAAAKPKDFDPETVPLDQLESVIDREYGVPR